MPPDARQVLDVMQVYDQTCLALCEGQFLDISFERRIDVTVDEYLEMIDHKTASLIAASVETAAILARDDPAVVAAFARFGERPGHRLPDRRRREGRLLAGVRDRASRRRRPAAPEEDDAHHLGAQPRRSR